MNYYIILSLLFFMVLLLAVTISYIKTKGKLSNYIYLYTILISICSIMSIILLSKKEYILTFITSTFHFTFSLYLNDDLSKISKLSVSILSFYIIFVFICVLMFLFFLFYFR